MPLGNSSLDKSYSMQGQSQLPFRNDLVHVPDTLTALAEAHRNYNTFYFTSRNRDLTYFFPSELRQFVLVPCRDSHNNFMFTFMGAWVFTSAILS